MDKQTLQNIGIIKFSMKMLPVLANKYPELFASLNNETMYDLQEGIWKFLIQSFKEEIRKTMIYEMKYENLPSNDDGTFGEWVKWKDVEEILERGIINQID